MHTCTLCLHGVPNIAVKIIITSEQETTWLGECHRCYTTDYVVVRIHGQLLVRTDVEKAACSIITPRRKCISIREELATKNTFLANTNKKGQNSSLRVCVKRGGQHSPSSYMLEAWVGSTYKQLQMAEFKWQSKACLSQLHRVYFHHQS
jgi:hypothetical protein